MPQNKFQEVVYGLLMTFFMVLAMELYNTALRTGGMSNACFAYALAEMRIMFPICFVMGFFGVDRLAPRLAFRMAKPGEDNPLLVTVVRACTTVAMMCPVMSFWATLIFKNPGREFFAVWLHTLACNFPMALCWQVFYCGPLVRWLFRALFVRRSSAEPAPDTKPERAGV